MLPPGVVQLKILRWLRGFRKQLPPSSTPQQYGESRFPFSSISYFLKCGLHYSSEWSANGDASSLARYRTSNERRERKIPSWAGTEWMSSTTYDDDPAIYDCRGKSWVKNHREQKKSRKRRRRRKGISLVLHTRVSGPDPSLRSACVYLIFPYTFCLELWQVANDARQEEEYKKWKGIFFLVLYFYLSHLFLPGYSSFAPVLAEWIGAPAPKGSKARAPATYNIYRRPCVHFFLVPTWNLRERAGPFYPPPKFWKCI